MNVTEFLNTNVKRYPLKPALGFKKNDEWKEINWTQFRTVVFKTANALKAAGIEEGDRVAIYSDNSSEWICFDLAIMAIGAITVPIYSTNHTDQVEYILENSEAKIIFVGNQEQYDICYQIRENQEFLDLIVVSKKAVWTKKDRSVFLEDFIKGHSEALEIVPKAEDDLATIIYTSGTTGVPKGVMLTHGNFNKCFKAHFDFFKFKNFSDEHSLAFLPLAHVFERSWTLLALSGGAKVSFLENTKLIASTLVEVKPTMMCAVPRFYQKIYAGVREMASESSAVKQKIFNWALQVGSQVAVLKRTERPIPWILNLKNNIAHALVFKKVKSKMGGKLWFMPCGGASISPEITRFFDAMGIYLTVGYGLTETTATLTLFPFTQYKHGTAGRPIGNTELKIGAENEILAKGDGIMKGYYLNEEATKEAFTEDGWFKTGDAGELDSDGYLTITDRIKDLMKTSNGKYIAPQQIENILSNNNYINQIMIVAEGKPFVSALIVPNFETLQEELTALDVTFTNWAEVVKHPKVIEFYQKKVAGFQQSLSGFEKVKKFALLPAEFEISSGEITPTLKIKRNIVLQKYADVIQQLYNH